MICHGLIIVTYMKKFFVWIYLIVFVCKYKEKLEEDPCP